MTGVQTCALPILSALGPGGLSRERAGLECGITLKDFADYKEKDVIEVYRITETERRI